MVNIYQDNASIGQQFVADEMHFGSVQSPADFAQALRMLQAEIQRGCTEKALSVDQAQQAQGHMRSGR
jgi:hypothetical protein